MLVKPVTSLALCALALTFAAPVGAVETSATIAVAPTNPGSGSIVKVVHRARKITRKKVAVGKAIDHHAEPVKSPVVAAVLTSPLTLASTKAHKEPPPPVVRTHGHAPEVMIGPKSPVAATSKVVKPAVIEVKSEPAHAGVRTPAAKIDLKPVKATVSSRPIASKEDEESTTDARVSLDVGTGDSKTISAASMSGPGSKAKVHGKAAAAKPLCMHQGIEFVRGEEAQTFSLTRCDGSVAPLAVEKLSVLARPDSAAIPRSVEALAKAKGPEIAPGIRRIDPGLVERIETIAEHFTAKGASAKVSVISGYRPMSSGSYHATAQALDMRIEGVPNEAVVEFCKSLSDTGCGYYPNSSFVHVDVRQPGTGHVAWIDASGPGETPRYVASWPPPPDPDVKVAEKESEENVFEKLDKELPPLPADEHPAVPGQAAMLSAPLELAK